MISQKAKYALRALVALCKVPAGESLMISEISRDQAIPKKFLEQILLELKRAGIVMSRRGRLGGYVLLRAPEQVTFGEVLRLIDGPIAPLPCLSKIAYRRCVDCADEVDLRDPPRLRPGHHRDARSAGPDDARRRGQRQRRAGLNGIPRNSPSHKLRHHRERQPLDGQGRPTAYSAATASPSERLLTCAR